MSATNIEQVMSSFGIGRAAARFHVGNAWWGQAELPSDRDIRAEPTDEQRSAEDFTLDYFQPQSTPEQRRGRFAVLAAEAIDAGLITNGYGSAIPLLQRQGSQRRHALLAQPAPRTHLARQPLNNPDPLSPRSAGGDVTEWQRGGRQERSPQIRSFGIGSEPTRSELSWRRATRISARLTALSSNAKSEREPLHVTLGPRSTCAQSHTAR